MIPGHELNAVLLLYSADNKGRHSNKIRVGRGRNSRHGHIGIVHLWSMLVYRL
jgi:hypothetical protein